MEALLAALIALVRGTTLAWAALSAAGVLVCPLQKQADIHFDRAERDYQAGHYERALKEYERASQLCPDAILILDMAQANRLLGRPESALDLYRRFLASGPEDGDARKLAEEWVASLAPKTTATPPPTALAPVSPPPAPAADRNPVRVFELHLIDTPGRGRASAKWQAAGPAIGPALVTAGLFGMVGGAIVLQDATAAWHAADKAETLRARSLGHDGASFDRGVGAAMMGISGAAIVAGALILHFLRHSETRLSAMGGIGTGGISLGRTF